MRIRGKVVGLVAMILGILIFWWVIGMTFMRYAHLYLTIISLLVLPLCYWKRFHYKKILIAALIISAAFTAGPVDFALQATGKLGLNVLPVSYELVPKPGTFSHGCIIPRNPPRYILVLSF